MAMACFASAGLSFSVLVRSRTVQVVAPRVPLRKLSSAAAGRETLPVWEAERMELSYADHRVIQREEIEVGPTGTSSVGDNAKFQPARRRFGLEYAFKSQDVPDYLYRNRTQYRLHLSSNLWIPDRVCGFGPPSRCPPA